MSGETGGSPGGTGGPPGRRGRPRGRGGRRSMLLIGIAIVSVFGTLVVVVVNTLSKPVPPPSSEVRQVTVFRPPPPPPPPEEPPPPPPEVEEEIETPEEPESIEEEVADLEPPPGDLLGLDADGVAGSDAFGLAARRGGRSLLAGGGGGDGYLFGQVERAIQERLADVSELRAAVYEVPAHVSFGADGCIEDVSLDVSTGDRERDRLLRSSVTGVCLEDGGTRERLASRSVKLRIASR